MSCPDCEAAHERSLTAYVRIENGNVALKGCTKHVRILLERLRENETLKGEKRALMEALEALPKLAALRRSIESELLSEAPGKEEGR